MQLGELARRIQGTLVGDGALEVTAVAPIDAAVPGDISFLPDYKLRKRLRLCRATACIVDRRSQQDCPISAVVVDCLLVGVARAANCLSPRAGCDPLFRHASFAFADIDPTAKIATTAALGNGVAVGQHSVLHPGCVIGAGVRIGSFCTIGSNVIIDAHATLGNRVTIGANSTIGGDAFVYVRDGERWVKLPSFGSACLGDDVDLGSNVTLDRGAIRDTIVMRGTKLGNQVHIGHGVVVGADVVIAARSTVAGEVNIGDACEIAGAVAIGEGLTIAPRVRITATSMVTKSLLSSGSAYSSGWPVMTSKAWWRQVSRISNDAFRKKRIESDPRLSS